jgi:nitrite reductase/ring-hydroxylating ferredoxin subunit
VSALTERIERTFNGRTYLRLCRSVEVVERHGKHVYVDIETDLALFRVADQAVALTNVCPHKREAYMFDGIVSNGTVTCPMHGWCFDVRTGKNLGVGGGLATYPVMERDGYVWLELLADHEADRSAWLNR